MAGALHLTISAFRTFWGKVPFGEQRIATIRTQDQADVNLRSRPPNQQTIDPTAQRGVERMAAGVLILPLIPSGLVEVALKCDATRAVIAVERLNVSLKPQAHFVSR